MDVSYVLLTSMLCVRRAAMIMVQTGPVVTLHVAKHAASCHGLEALINQPGSAPNTGITHHLEINCMGSGGYRMSM